MKLIWTHARSNDLITWGLDQSESHFILDFLDSSICFHSTFLGTNIETPQTVYERRVISHVEEIKLPLKVEICVLQKLIQKYGGKEYDWEYFTFLLMAGIKHKIFGQEVPRRATINSKGLLICHEALQAAKEALDEIRHKNIIPDIDFSRAATPTYLKEEYLIAKGQMNG